MKTVTTAAAALLTRLKNGEHIPILPLLYLALTVPQRWSLAGIPVTWGGNTYAPQEVQIERVQHSVSTIGSLRITVPGVTLAQRALAFEDVDGKACTLYLGIVDPATMVVEDAVTLWDGFLDVAGWEDGATPTIQFTAEHIGAYALRQRITRYTSSEQQRLYSGDTSLDYDPATDSAPIVWPYASYWKV